jgi:acyl-CoA synthetase (AMP-forming)/AMP-acid ligase II
MQFYILKKCAIVFGEKRISFSEYHKLCNQCAAGLIKEGIKTSDRVAILSSNCDDFMDLCGAAAKIGAVVVPVNFRLSEEKLNTFSKMRNEMSIFQQRMSGYG